MHFRQVSTHRPYFQLPLGFLGNIRQLGTRRPTVPESSAWEVYVALL